MTTAGVVERFERVLTADPGALSVDEISSWMHEALLCQSALDLVMVRLSAAADRLAADPLLPSGPGGEALLRQSRLSNHHASKIARRGRVVDAFPNLAEALGDGEIRGEHLDVLGNVLDDVGAAKRPAFCDPFIADGLLDVARRVSPTKLAREARAVARILDEQAGETAAKRIRRQRRLRFTRHHDGTISVHGTLDATGAEVRRLVEAEAAKLRAAEKELSSADRSTDEQLNADALTSLIRGGATHGGVTKPVNPTFIVTFTLEDLIELFRSQQTHATTSDGLPLTVEFAQSLVPTACLVPVLLDQSGLPIELAKDARKRLATMMQRAVLSAMNDNCCEPDCDTPFDDCEIHHLGDFDGGNTVIANLAPLCKHDHREHHAGRRVISMDADRNITVTLPDGTIWSHQEYRPPERGQPRARAG